MSAKHDSLVDHIDGNRLNNEWHNLRLVNSQQSNWNRAKALRPNGKPPSSKYKGVCWKPLDKKWEANITVNGKTRYLGKYQYEQEAAEAYNRAPIAEFHEYARINK
jgi:AP2 domain/HNH endonuclease